MSPYRRLLGYVLRYRRDFLKGLACVIVTRSVAVAGPWVLGYAIDDLKTGVTQTWSLSPPVNPYGGYGR